MKATVLFIATVNFFYRSALVASTNDTCSNVQNQYSLRTPEEDSWKQSEKYFGLFRERSSLGITNMFTPLRFLDYVMEDGWPDHLVADQAERDSKRVFSRGARQALRQFVLEKTGVPEVLSALTPKFIERSIFDTLSGREERNILPSPFHSEEGLPIQDGIRRRYGVKAGFRPFSTNPYGYVSFGTKPDAWGESFQVNTRVYATDWQEGHLQLVGNYYFNSKSALVLACDARPWLSAEKKSEGNKSLALSAGFQTILPLGTFFVGVSGPSTIIKAAYSLDW